MTPTLILLVMAGYVALLYAVAHRAARHADNPTFFTGRRDVKWWVVALGMIGAPMSGVSFVSVPGEVATGQFHYLQMVMGFTVGQLVVAYLLVPLFYRLRCTSLYEYLQSRFGDALHRVGALLFITSKLLAAALKLYVVILVLDGWVGAPLGIPFGVNVAVATLLVWGFTLRGGVRSVVWTDILQTLCLVSAVGVTLFLLQERVVALEPHYWRELLHSAPERIFCFGDPSSTRSFWSMFLGGILLLVGMTGLDQDMMQRNLSCRSPRHAQRNILLTAISQAVVISGLLLLGDLLHRYALQSQLPPVAPDARFAQVALQGGLPLGVGILFVLGLVSSTYSTAGSALTALTTSCIYDLMPRLTHSPQRLRRARYAIHTLLALALGGVMLGVHLMGSQSLIQTLFTWAGYTYGPLLGLFLYGLLTRRQLHPRGAILAVVAAPLLSAFSGHLLQKYGGLTLGHALILLNTLYTLAGLHLCSYSTHETH